MKSILSESDQERIREAVAEAERRTSGEIVPFVVPRSDVYEAAVWKGAAAGAVLALLLAVLVFNFYGGWGFGWLHTGWGTALLVTLCGLGGGLLTAFVPPLRRTLAGADAMTRNVHRYAMKAFVEEEVFDTRERTGILLFVSLFEHRIEVLGDAGINRLVSSDEWAEVVEHIRDGIRAGRFADGLVEGITMCGHLLEKSGVEVREDDTDELANRIRFRRDS